MLRIFLTGCDPVLSDAVRNTFLPEGAFEICVEQKNGIQAIMEAIELSPDLVILGEEMLAIGDGEVAETLKMTMPEVQVFLVTELYGMEAEKKALSHGIDAVFERHDDLISLVMNARAVCGLGSLPLMN